MLNRVRSTLAALLALAAVTCLSGSASAAVYTVPAASVVKEIVGSPLQKVYHRYWHRPRYYYRRYYRPRRYYRRYYYPRRYYYRPYYRRYYRPGIYLRLF